MQTEFVVYGEPTGKGRPRFTSFAGHARPYTPKKTEMAEAIIRCEYERQVGKLLNFGSVPVRLAIKAYSGIPKAASKAKRLEMELARILPTKKPDIDNIVKLVMDSLNGVAWEDDKQVCTLEVRKLYSKTPRLEICICEMNSNEEVSTL